MVGAVGLTMVVATITPATAHSLKDLEDQLLKREAYVEIVNKKAPEFTLQGADGTRVRLSDFAGKVVVLNFVYTNCPDVCPLHSEAITSIQESINRTPMMDVVQFVTITTDPARDTPVVMHTYGPTHGLDRVNWVFLTSGPDRPAATRELAGRYGLKFAPSQDGYQMHGVVTHLIDKSGNLRARYHGLKFNETNMIVHINALTNDYH
jgi:protein SCO1/2